MKMTGKVKKVIFLYSASEADEYIRNNKNALTSSENELFVALSPNAYSTLKKDGKDVKDTLEYFTNESHMQLLEKSKILEDWLRKNSDFKDIGIGVSQSYKDSFIFWARRAIHYCLWVIEIVCNALDKHKPEILCACLSGKNAVSSQWIESEERYLGYIVKSISHLKNLEFEDASRKTRNQGLFISRLTSNVSSLTDFLIRYARFQLWEKMLLVKSIFNKQNPIFFTTAYNTDAIVKEFRNKISYHCYFLKAPVIASFSIPNFLIRMFCGKYSAGVIEQKKKFEILECLIKKEAELFSYKRIEFTEVVTNKIKDNISKFILGQSLWSVKLNKFFDALKPFLLISNGTRLDNITIAELCRHKNIPAVLVSHASDTMPKNEYEEIEWGNHGRFLLRAPFSFLALQSPLAEGYLNTFPTSGHIIKTGPLVWGRPINLEKSKFFFRQMFKEQYNFEKTRIILHAGTPKRDGIKCYIYETPDEYIQAINDLANAVEEIPDTVLIVKFRVRREISIRDLYYRVPFSKKVVLSISEPFLDVLGMSNLLVSFSSTAIEEALQNKIPVLLYGGSGRYQHVSAYEVESDKPVPKSAIYHVKNAEHLEYAVRGILDLGLNRDVDGHLFKRYIYPDDARVSLADLLKNVSQ